MVWKSSSAGRHEDVLSLRHAGALKRQTNLSLLFVRETDFKAAHLKSLFLSGIRESRRLHRRTPPELWAVTWVHLGFVPQQNGSGAAGLVLVGCNPHSSLFLIRPAFSEQTFHDPVSLTAEYLASNTIRCLMLTFPHPFALQPSETVMKLLFSYILCSFWVKSRSSAKHLICGFNCHDLCFHPSAGNDWRYLHLITSKALK